MDYQNFTHEMAQALSHYMRDPTRNKVSAYRHAFDCTGMTAGAVSARAGWLFRHPVILEAIAHLGAEALEHVKVDARWVTERLVRLAEFNINKFLVVDEDGRASYDFSDATDEDWYCINEYNVDTVVKPRKGGEEPVVVEKVKLSTYDRLKALKLLGELAGVDAFRQNVVHSGEVRVRNFNDFYDETEPES